ncbi:rhomboid family intramembrane serine protease [Solimonas sp. K1W22B-7]|uniref:rhomboid family intramembrane serine protease n=1 Tax=Solimonas sp. K1W22B-7 TaxID=2303331 RepID=UPI000E335C2A|nr:rhomboid family intramembrane serine protease [Solimonas sp. K1W22B-7]AXQ31474.1 rhomboid family intramembrane serine protease [Solimonas sp. K1W22B-7]
MRTPVTLFLLIANIAIFLLQLQASDGLIPRYALWPLGEGFQPWQLVTSAFLHGGMLHLAVNMFGVWTFGRELEQALGPLRFLRLYAVSVLAAAATQLVAVHFGKPVPTVGASGGLFGLLAAYAILFPDRKLLLLFPPIPLPAPLFVVLYAAFELYAGVTGTLSGVAHFAHLGGLAGGLLVLGKRRGRASRR